jgi:Ca2+:H+ antiporter
MTAVGLVLPAVYNHALMGRTDLQITNAGEIPLETLKISRATAVILLCAYAVYIFFQTKTHDGILGEVYEHDELHDKDRHEELAKDKLTMTECIFALAVSIAIVSMIAVFLVLQIPFIVEERHISDAFIGLILIPVVEKAAGKKSSDCKQT